MQTLSFQAPVLLSKKLTMLAKKLDRSKGYLIREALVDYLEDLQDYVAVASEKKTHRQKQNLSLAEIKRKYKLQ